MKENLTITRVAILGILLLLCLSLITIWNLESGYEIKKNNSLQNSLLKLIQAKQRVFEKSTIENPALIMDSTAQHILFIGDSMAEGLNIALQKYAKFNGHQLTTIAKTSASIAGWVGNKNGGRLKKAIEEYKPSYVMISLGSNELFTNSLDVYEKYVENILAQVGSTKLIWVCPPNWKEDKGLTDLIEKEVGSNRFFPSKKLKLKRAGDGIHPTYQGYSEWMDAIASWIMESSRHKILLLKPTEETNNT